MNDETQDKCLLKIFIRISKAMFVTICTLSIFFLSGNADSLLSPKMEPKGPIIPICVKKILQKYFAEGKMLVYVNMDPEANDLLTIIHSMEIAVTLKTATSNVLRTNFAYFIVVQDVPSFKQNIIFLNKEASWNPYARFLVVIKTLELRQLFQVFDIFLTRRVVNAVVVNASETAELYTYNPYENFACGKYYSRLIEYGKCLEVNTNIYPEKVTTGLRNCFFNVSISHWPPYTLDPSKVTDDHPMGTEQYIFNLISEIEQFKHEFHVNYDPEATSVVSDDMSVTGPMLMLANNHTDVMLGGLMLVPSRAKMFFYIFGYLDYADSLRLMVKKAGPSPAWKDLYRGFTPLVWLLLFLFLILYSVVLLVLLRANDRGRIVLILYDHLFSHGRSLRSRQTVKLVFFMWVIFAFLINCFYTTILMSLTTKPSMGFQIKDEQTMNELGLQPCVSSTMNNYLIKSVQYKEGKIKGCETFLECIKSVSEAYSLFTLVLYSAYLYNTENIYDEYGASPVYSFTKPYTKVILAIFFPSGFPMYDRLHLVALRIRESGLADKSLNDQFYYQKVKQHFRSKGFEARFAVPWYPYIIGLCLSLMAFVVELASKIKQRKIKISPVVKEVTPDIERRRIN